MRTAWQRFRAGALWLHKRVPVHPRAYWAAGIVFAVIAVNTLAPAYQAPDSRLYSSVIGYPSLMRLLHLPIRVDTHQVALREMVNVIAASGFTGYLNEVSINTEITGVVTGVSVQPGDPVEAGQILMTVGTAEAVSRRLEVEPVLGAPGEGGPLSASMPGEIEILSPIAGRVVSTSVVRGENIIAPRNSVIIIGDQPVFKAALDQRYVAWVKRGQQATVYLSAYPGRVFHGQVVRVDHQVAPINVPSRIGQPPLTFMVWIDLMEGREEDVPFATGMNGYCVIESPKQTLSMPEGAVLRFSGQQALVMKVKTAPKPLRTQLVPVTYTLSADGWVAVASGVEAGDTVIVSGQAALRENDKVSPRDTSSLQR